MVFIMELGYPAVVVLECVMLVPPKTGAGKKDLPVSDGRFASLELKLSRLA